MIEDECDGVEPEGEDSSPVVGKAAEAAQIESYARAVVADPQFAGTNTV